MKSEFSKHLRSGLIALLAWVGVLFLAGEPVNEETWMQDFLISQAVGFALWGLCYLLFKYWERKRLLPDELLEEEKV